MRPTWISDAIFYHIYPLGLCDAPPLNDFSSAPVQRLERIYDWIAPMSQLGVNALYLGPVFESTAHGYDSVDLFKIDRRLGDNQSFKRLIQTLKQNGIRIVLDGVFNHVGRDFWAFRDVQVHEKDSPYIGWFHNLNFNGRSPYGDPFSYEGWAGHYDLIKLNTSHPEVRQYLFDAITFWVQAFDIDGLRLDTADHLSPDFIRALTAHCRSLKTDFWLMGEVVHGDYRNWANADMLDATTNYECFKGLYSSHVDCNYFEMAYSLNRLFGDEGIYRHLQLYNFADNHDVNRVASNLTNPAHLYPLYGLLFTMPGIPSIYYGSEWGITGERTASSDHKLRSAIDLRQGISQFPQPELASAIQRFAALRHSLPALQVGDYRQLYVAHEQLAFGRTAGDQAVIVAANASNQTVPIHLHDLPGMVLEDRLNSPDRFSVENGQATIPLYPNWIRMMIVR